MCLTVSRPLYAKVGVNIYHQQYLVNEQSAVISAHLLGDHLFIHIIGACGVCDMVTEVV